ncbi:MAG: cytochrome C oxidase subunit IV family protein [Candidatus Omnitrophica bacterium]|nr:cytochrome C oxidase subunit IV family protein [Candidatus Omnitrophota bacterium]
MMNQKQPTIKSYLGIFGWLVVLTVIEIVAANLGLPKLALAIFLVGTALAKVLLIALYFMHLKFESGLIWWIPGIPMALAVFFVLMLFPDIVYHLTNKY